MQKQFTPCPACGALGEVNCSCQFCGSTITLKEGTIATDSRVVKQRTVTPQQYAEKITLYHNVEPVGLLKIVSIGKEYGVVNLNGDLIYPLGSDEIQIVNDNTIELGHTYKKVWEEASTYWDECDQKWIHKEEDTTEYFNIRKFFNLETCMYADKFGFIKDKEDPKKLYRVNIDKNWEPMHSYINVEGDKQSFEYAESIEIENINRQLYLLHNGNECSLWLTYASDIDDFNHLNLSPSNFEPQIPICVLNGIQKEYRIKKHKGKTHIILKTLNNIDVTLTLSVSNEDLRIDDIYNEWNNVTKDFIKRITKNITLDTKLLKQIDEYIKEIKSNPNLEKMLEIYFSEDCLFLVENNTVNTDWLPNKQGVSLTTACAEIMNDDQYEIFEESVIYTIFKDCEDYSSIYIDFSFDAKSLCATIQYLAQLYDCPIKNITIKQSKYDTPANEEDKVIFKIIGVLLIIGSLFFFYFGFEYSEMFIVSAICAITSVFCIKYANKV